MRLFILVLTLFSSAIMYSQNSSSINGQLFDAEFNNEPLAFGTVSIKGSVQKTTANLDGTYSFQDIKPGKYVLVYSFVGYKTQERTVEVALDKTSTVNITMEMLKPSANIMATSESSDKDDVSLSKTKA